MVGSISSVLAHLNTISSNFKINSAELLTPLPTNVIASKFLGYASIFFWICVFIPQIYENWTQKSSASVSFAFVLLWAIGDIFNLVGSIAQHLVLTAILLAAYYLISDFILVSQVLYYTYYPGKPLECKIVEEPNQEFDSLLTSTSSSTVYGTLGPKSSEVILPESTSNLIRISPVKKIILVSFFILIPSCALIATLSPQIFLFEKNNVDFNSQSTEKIEVVWWAALCGWISTGFFCFAKIPQIILNFKRKSTDGLSMIMFIFCCLGNLTYIMSILLYSQKASYLAVNLPWLAGAALPFIFDFTIFAQYFIYRNDPQSSLPEVMRA